MCVKCTLFIEQIVMSCFSMQLLEVVEREFKTVLSNQRN